MNVGINVRRLAALGLLAGASLAAGPGQARAAADPIVDITLPVNVCGLQIGVVGGAAGDCPTTTQAPAIGVNLAPITSGEILAPVTGILENPGVLLNPEALPTLLDPNTIGNVVNGGNPVINVDTPVLVCGNAVGALTDSGANCPDAPAAGSGQSSTANGNVQVTVCGNGLGVLDTATGNCGDGTGDSGNSVGLPMGLGDVVPANSIANSVGGGIVGPGGLLDVQQIINDLGLGSLLGLNVQVDACGNGAAVAQGASAACPLAAPGTTTPGTTTPDTTTPATTTPTTAAPTTSTPGVVTTTPGAGTTGPDGSGSNGGNNAGDGSGGAGGGGGNGGGGLLPTTGGTVVPLLGLGTVLAAAGLLARRASKARRAVPA